MNLTHRQVEVLRALADGRTHQQVARDLGIAYPTLRNHLQAVYRQLEAPGNLVAVYAALGWLRVPEARA